MLNGYQLEPFYLAAGTFGAIMDSNIWPIISIIVMIIAVVGAYRRVIWCLKYKRKWVAANLLVGCGFSLFICLYAGIGFYGGLIFAAVLSIGAWAKTKDEKDLPETIGVLPNDQSLSDSVSENNSGSIEQHLSQVAPDKDLLDSKEDIQNMGPYKDEEGIIQSEEALSYCCPMCKVELDVPERFWGKVMKCGGCREDIDLPSLVEKAPPVLISEGVNADSLLAAYSRRSKVIVVAVIFLMLIVCSFLFINRIQTLQLTDQVTFIGKAFLGSPSGEGRIVFKNIGYSDVEFSSGVLKSEITVHLDSGGVSVGRLSNDYKPTGEHKLSFASGDVYTGTLSQSFNENGGGVYVFKDGRKLVGQFQNGLCQDGMIMYAADGGEYEVPVDSKGRLNGKGTYHLIGGGKIVGTWENSSILYGYTYIWKDGRRYSGEWKGNTPHGLGVISFDSGEKVKAYLKEGYFSYGYDDPNYANMSPKESVRRAYLEIFALRKFLSKLTHNAKAPLSFWSSSTSTISLKGCPKEFIDKVDHLVFSINQLHYATKNAPSGTESFLMGVLGGLNGDATYGLRGVANSNQKIKAAKNNLEVALDNLDIITRKLLR